MFLHHTHIIRYIWWSGQWNSYFFIKTNRKLKTIKKTKQKSLKKMQNTKPYIYMQGNAKIFKKRKQNNERKTENITKTRIGIF